MTELAIGKPLPKKILEATLYDRAGDATTLGRRLAGGAAVIVFLRHFGCVGCSSQVDDLAPLIPQLAAMGMTVIFVGNGGPHFIDGFIERHRLAGYDAVVLTDPSLESYQAAGFERSRSKTYGARALYHEILLIGRGYLPRAVEGDRYQQGGVVIVDDDGSVALHVHSRAATDPVGAGVIAETALELATKKARTTSEVA
jgi:peroxiredoxin